MPGLVVNPKAPDVNIGDKKVKRYLSKFKLTENFILESMFECLSHKTNNTVRWNRKDTSYFLADYYIRGGFTESENLHKTAEFIHNDIHSNFTFYHDILVPYIAKELYLEIKNRSIRLSPINYQERIDPSSGKIRVIGIASIKQQVYDYICVNALKPMLNAKIGYYQCASIKGRGQKRAKKAIEKCIRKKYKKARYVIKSDIRKCYQSIRHDILFSLLERDVKNDDVLYLTIALVTTYSGNGIGLCIGTYLSQYLANYFLSYAYHYATEAACVSRKDRKTGKMKKIHPFTRVVFYMDDMVFIGANKKYMKQAMKTIVKYLIVKLNLELKNGTYQVIDLFQPGSFVDVVGYRFYKNRTTIRKRIFRRISNDVKIIRKHGINAILNVCKGFMSRHGFIKSSDSVKFKRKSKYNTAYRLSREVIRSETKSNVYRYAARCKIYRGQRFQGRCHCKSLHRRRDDGY